MDVHHILIVDIIKINPQIFFSGDIFLKPLTKLMKNVIIYAVQQKGEEYEK